MNESKKIIARHKEIALFKQLFQSDRSEFVAVYGRRRVGKTFLIKELFKDDYAFYLTGQYKASMKKQLGNFFSALHAHFPNTDKKEMPESWSEAFQILTRCLEKKGKGKKVIFIDELPWIGTRRSDFISSLEHFWNGWAYHRDDILLIICGSSTLWMIEKIINDRGGLHNRVTKRIRLLPFDLNETEAFLKSKGGVYDRYQIIQLYMTMGGIPFYLDEIDTKKSIAQNIDHLFFSDDGILKSEFQNLYRSLFKKHERHIAIIEALAKKSKGLLRTELAQSAKLKNGGALTKVLRELEQCGFIRKYLPFGKKQRGSLYQLTDQYSLFYLKFMKNSKVSGEGAWLLQQELPTWRAWSGYAFEQICFYHIEKIKTGLGIKGVYTEISGWRSEFSEKGAQIDLIIDRRDRIIHLCEIKFSIDSFTINKTYAENLKNKVSTFRRESKTKKTLFLTFITAFGLKKNAHAINLVQSDIDMNIFFE